LNLACVFSIATSPYHPPNAVARGLSIDATPIREKQIVVTLLTVELQR
jgi:hypothetical protein